MLFFHFQSIYMDGFNWIVINHKNRVGYLVSWNFKHIVNVFRIRGYNSINLRNGYIQLGIRSPKEIVSNEDGN